MNCLCTHEDVILVFISRVTNNEGKKHRIILDLAWTKLARNNTHIVNVHHGVTINCAMLYGNRQLLRKRVKSCILFKVILRLDLWEITIYYVFISVGYCHSSIPKLQWQIIYRWIITFHYCKRMPQMLRWSLLIKEHLEVSHNVKEVSPGSDGKCWQYHDIVVSVLWILHEGRLHRWRISRA